jgi:NAD(P)-dependent dehydrogenase (short-subunit alcohol dehydrogenase family)/acyl dehydratase
MGVLDGKVAVITGAGGGLGRCHALEMARQGADVLINDVNADNAAKVADEVRELGRKAAVHSQDISTWEGAETLVKQAQEDLGRIDILVNNAGILRDKTMKKLSEEHWDQVIQVHLKGTFACSRFAALAFAEQGEGGRIVNTTSIAGLKGNFGQSNYSAAKAGIYALTRTHSMELARDGVTVNAIAPVAKTDMTADLDAVSADLKPEMVSPLVTWLCSEEASGVTGRIFGAHGNHYFEYEMKMSDGVDKAAEDWTVAEVGERLEDIGRFVAPAAAGGGGGDGDLIGSVFANLQHAFRADKAAGWNATMNWMVDGAGTWNVVVKDGAATIGEGEAADPTCKVEVGAATLAGMVKGTVDPNQAFMKGDIKASKVPDLGKFGKVFAFDAAFLAVVTGEAEPGEAPGASTSGEGAEEEKPGDGLVNPDGVGLKYRGPARLARPEHIQAYADATNDANPRYQAGDEQVGGPLFPVTYVMDLFMTAMGDPKLGVDMGRVVHGEQEITYLQPIQAWDLLNPRSHITSITGKSSGWLVAIDQDIWREGEKVVEMKAGIFVRGHKKKGGAKKEAREPPARPEPKFTVTAKVDPDQSERYAEASGDHNRIHLDAEFAKAVGLPDRILHGLCTLAMATGAIVNEGLGGDPSRLKRIKVRFSKPVLMGDELTTTVWEVARDDREVTWGFEVTNQHGDPVITGGEAQVLD